LWAALVSECIRAVCFEEQAIDWKQTVHKADVDKAAEILIKRRDVHLDQLADKMLAKREWLEEGGKRIEVIWL